MPTNPGDRPSHSDLRNVLQNIGKPEFNNQREDARIALSVPAEIVTRRGNLIPCLTRDISRRGIGLLHLGSIIPEEVTVYLAGDMFENEYRVQIEWCHPCDNGMFMSGGRFVSQNATET